MSNTIEIVKTIEVQASSVKVIADNGLNGFDIKLLLSATDATNPDLTLFWVDTNDESIYIGWESKEAQERCFRVGRIFQRELIDEPWLQNAIK